MYNKLIVAKTRFFMNSEDRKRLSAEMADMMSNGALVVGDEVDHLLILDVDTGKVIPIKTKEQKQKENLSHVEKRRKKKSDIVLKIYLKWLKKFLARSQKKKDPRSKNIFEGRGGLQEGLNFHSAEKF